MDTTAKLTPIQRFINLLKVDRQEIISLYVYALFYGIVSLSLPLGIQAIINLIGGGQTSTSWILLVIFVILGVAFTGILQVMQLNISENIQQKIFTRSAFEFAFRIPRIKREAVDKAYIPELVNRFFDTLSVQKGLSKILMDFSGASLQIIFGLILLCLYHPFFIFFSLVLVLILYLIFRFTAPKGMVTSLNESKNKYEVAHWLEELARVMETFKLVSKSELPMQRTDAVVEGYLKSRKEHWRTLMFQYINLVGFKVIIAAGLLLIGGLLVINEQMNIGQFVAAEIIIILILSSVEKLILSMETIYDVLAAIEKIGNVADIPLDRDEGVELTHNGDQGLSLRLDNLAYQFTDDHEDIISGIDLHINAGEKICISGFDGAGKSLLLQMIAGYFENFSGYITYNDIPLSNLRKEALNEMIRYYSSREDIFRGTLKENLTLGRENIDMEDIQRVIEICGLQDFVRSASEGYDTLQIPEGKNLPRSIRRKIILARTLLGNPKLILLDDEFNNFSEKDKERILTKLLRSKITLIAISNDLMFCQRFDRSLILHDGQLLYDGDIGNAKKEKWFDDLFYNSQS